MNALENSLLKILYVYFNLKCEVCINALFNYMKHCVYVDVQVLIDLSNTSQLDNVPRWLPLKEQSEGEHHRRSHSGHGRQHSPKTSSHSKDDSPRSSVIKSRSHGIFPDPAKGRSERGMPSLCDVSHSFTARKSFS